MHSTLSSSTQSSHQQGTQYKQQRLRKTGNHLQLYRYRPLSGSKNYSFSTASATEEALIKKTRMHMRMKMGILLIKRVKILFFQILFIHW